MSVELPPIDAQGRAQLRADIWLSLPARTEFLARQVTQSVQHARNPPIKQLYLQIHSLEQVSALLDLPELGAVTQPFAAYLQTLLTQEAAPEAAPAATVQQQITRYLEALQKLSAQAAPDAPAKQLWLLTPALSLAEVRQHFPAVISQAAASIAVLEAQLADDPQTCSLVLLSPEQLAQTEVQALLQNAKKRRGAQFSFFVVGPQEDLRCELKAMRGGAEGFLSLGRIWEQLGSLLNEKTAQPFSGQKILIIDDSITDANFSRALLQRVGLQVETLQDPLQIVQTVERMHPDLILMDVHMPQASGLEIAALLRRRPAFKSLPIIFLSGETDPEVQAEALASGAQDFLEKPILPKQLLAVVANCLRKSRPAGSAPAGGTGTELGGGPGHLAAPPPVAVPLTQTALLVRLEQLARLSQRTGTTVGLIYLAWENPAAGTLALGAPIFAQIKAGMPQVNAVGYYGQQGLVLLFAQADNLRQEVEVLKIRLLDALKNQYAGTIFHIGHATSSTAHYMAWLKEAELTARKIEFEPAPPAATNSQIIRTLINRIDERALALSFQPLLKLRGGLANRDTRPAAQAHLYRAIVSLTGKEYARLGTRGLKQLAQTARLEHVVDQWSLEQSLRALAQQRKQAEQAALFVPLSAAMLANTGLPVWLLTQLNQAGLPSRRLIAQFSVEDVMTYIKPAQAFFKALQGMEIPIALTNFGKSTNPFLLFKHLDAQYLWFDEQLTQKIHQDDDSARTLELLVDTAQSMGKQTVVQLEGTEALTVLWHMRVDYVTGDFIGPPAPQMNYDFPKYEEWG